MIRCCPKCSANAATVACVASGSLTSAGAEPVQANSGGSAAPLACDSAAAMRSMALRTLSRIAGVKVRTLIPNSALSGMMLSFVPACRRPTVTTAVSAGGTSRATIPCNRVTTLAAMSTGSTDASGGIRGRRDRAG